jgi:putative membrane protein
VRPVPSPSTDPLPPRSPDPRFTLANERTLLAWTRTALAFVAAGLAFVQLLDDLQVPGGRRVIGVPLIVVGAVVAVASGARWRSREASIARGEPVAAAPFLPWLVAGSVAVIGAVAVVVTMGQ